MTHALPHRQRALLDGRHIERAENTARLLDVTYRMSLLPYHAAGAGAGVGGAVGGAADHDAAARPPSTRSTRELTAENVLRFMVLDAGNPSSIFCCLRAARESARAVRGAITSEMYEDLNARLARDAQLRLRARAAHRRLGVPATG